MTKDQHDKAVLHHSYNGVICYDGHPKAVRVFKCDNGKWMIVGDIVELRYWSHRSILLGSKC